MECREQWSRKCVERWVQHVEEGRGEAEDDGICEHDEHAHEISNVDYSTMMLADTGNGCDVTANGPG